MKKYDKNNVFAKIIRGEIPATKVYEDENVLAFNDLSALAPVHVLVIPKGEYIDFADFVVNESEQRVANFFKAVANIAKKLDIDGTGYRIISNKGDDASQSVAHFHVHLLGKKKLGPLIVGDDNH